MKSLIVVALFVSFASAGPYDWPRWPQDFRWSSAGRIPGFQCLQIIEIADPYTWNDNFFCWIQRPGYNHPGFRWSSAGPVPGMNCVQTIESADPHTWRDNYLCWPKYSPYHFTWSSAGPRETYNVKCQQWLESADPHTWNDNYLCGKISYYDK